MAKKKTRNTFPPSLAKLPDRSVRMLSHLSFLTSQLRARSRSRQAIEDIENTMQHIGRKPQRPFSAEKAERFLKRFHAAANPQGHVIICSSPAEMVEKLKIQLLALILAGDNKGIELSPIYSMQSYGIDLEALAEYEAERTKKNHLEDDSIIWPLHQSRHYYSHADKVSQSGWDQSAIETAWEAPVKKPFSAVCRDTISRVLSDAFPNGVSLRQGLSHGNIMQLETFRRLNPGMKDLASARYLFSAFQKGGLCWVGNFKNTFFAIASPETILTDEAGAPHSDSQPAVLWKDGTKQFYVHGTLMPEEVMRPDFDFVTSELNSYEDQIIFSLIKKVGLEAASRHSRYAHRIDVWTAKDKQKEATLYRTKFPHVHSLGIVHIKYSDGRALWSWIPSRVSIAKTAARLGPIYVNTNEARIR
jgi:hypothetical protein